MEINVELSRLEDSYANMTCMLRIIWELSTHIFTLEFFHTQQGNVHMSRIKSF